MSTTTEPTASTVVSRYGDHHPTSTLTRDDARVLLVASNHLPAFGGHRPNLHAATDVAGLAAKVVDYIAVVERVMEDYQQELEDYRALLADVEATRRVLGLSLAQPPNYDDVDTGVGGE